jgi:hypothetical protein
MRIYKAFPTAVYEVAGGYGCPLGQAAVFKKIISDQLKIVQFLVQQHPKCASLFSPNGWLPLHLSVTCNCPLDITRLVYDAYPQAVSTSTTIEDGYGGELPINVLMREEDFESENDLSLNTLRFLIDKYPESVGIPNVYGDTAYSISADKPDFVKRLILRAKPDLNPQEHADLNYAARRMALFLGFIANTGAMTGEPSIWIKLREHDLNLFKRVVSYL